MIDNECVKALECCIKSNHFGECFENKCPLVSDEGCKVGKETLYPYALDLITRQKAKIEALQKAIKLLEIMNDQQKAEVERLRAKVEKRTQEKLELGRIYTLKLKTANAEIERLQKNNILPSEGFFNLLCGALVYTKTLEEYNKFRRTFKAEAIKEFDERLKEDCLSYPLEKDDKTMLVDVDSYNNLVKEMVGDV